MFILGLLPLLQAIACGFTIFGGLHALQTTDTVVQYGAGADGPTAAEWMNSFGSLAFGLMGLIGTHIASKKAGTKSEFAVALAYWCINRSDPAATRRLAFAAMDWIEQAYVASVTDPEDKAWWDSMLKNFRGRFAEQPSVAPPAAGIKK